MRERDIRRVSVRRSLITRTVLLLLAALLAVLLAFDWLLLRPAAREISRTQMLATSERVQNEFSQHFHDVSRLLSVAVAWARKTGLQPADYQELNATFAPLLAESEHLSSMMMASPEGREWLLMARADGSWYTRVTDVPLWGDESTIIEWRSLRERADVSRQVLGYDPRQRPWFLGAMNTELDQLFWTQPYIFFTTQEPGITAAMAWRDLLGNLRVMAVDMRLRDLAQFTTGLQLSPRGHAVVLDDAMALMGLPRSSIDQTALDGSVLLQPALEHLGPALRQGLQAWQDRGQPQGDTLAYTHAGEAWFTQVVPIDVGGKRWWIASFAPQSDFIPTTFQRQYPLLGILLVVLLFASWFAAGIARRFTLPLEQLVAQSQRFGSLQLDARVDVDTSLREVHQLVKAQETMRVLLRDATSALERSRDELEDTVEHRTQALADQLAFQTVLLDTLPNPIFFKGEDGRFMGFNAAYEEVFGIRREDLIGRTVMQLDFLPQQDREFYHREDSALLRDGGMAHHELKMTFSDGLEHDVLYWVRSFDLSDGSRGGLIGIFVDISDQKRAEQQLREAQAVAEAATRAKSEFLANMSHEIRTPMNAVIGLGHLVLQTELSHKQRDYLNKLHNAAQSLLGIINDILDFSKIEAGKLDLESIDFDLQQVLDNLAAVAAVRAEEKGIELLVSLEPDVPMWLHGDPLRLGQVLINLVNNALKFTERGEVVLHISRMSQTDDDSMWLHFTVTDTGIGMSEEQLARLFQPFSQADGSTTRKFGGTGLGLSISRRLVDMMGGHFEVSSDLGRGSCFSFDAHFAAGKAERRERLILPHRLDKLRVLVVDDNPGAREVLTNYCQSLGFVVGQVGSGSEALYELVQADPYYQLVLLDWKMPGMNGIETAQRIQALTQLPRQPVIIMVSAYSHSELQGQARALALAGFLVKPVSPSSLLNAILFAFGEDAGPFPGSLAGPFAGPLAGLESQLPKLDAKLKGARLLVVEDNDINQQIAQELLENAGTRVDLANNGAEALAMLQRTAYDAVLMDIQMPVMDGLEATRRIRALPEYASLPVIAMTANAMASDREQCLDAGMNDHVAKPIDVAQLFDTLARWVRTDHHASPIASQSGATRDEPLPALPGLAVDEALLRMGGDARLYRKVLQRFLHSQADAVERIRASLALDAREDAQRHAHTLKGLAGNIGASALQAQALAVEHAIVAGESQDLEALDDALQAVLTELRGAGLAAELEVSAPSNPDSVMAWSELTPQRQALRLALEENAAEAVTLVDELCRRAPEHAELKQLQRLVSEYAFDEALALLDQLPH